MSCHQLWFKLWGCCYRHGKPEDEHQTVILSYFKRNEDTRVSKLDRMDTLLGRTNFTSEELKRWYKKFKKENPSGTITIKELKQILGSRFPDGSPEEAAKRIMEIFDSDNDGTLDFTELMTALSITRKGTKEEKLRLAFSMADVDNSGTIDMQEMTQLIEDLHKLVGITVTHLSKMEDTPDCHAQQMMNEFDQNEDRVVTFEEFCEGVEKNPNLAGLITNFANPEMICSNFIK